MTQNLLNLKRFNTLGLNAYCKSLEIIEKEQDIKTLIKDLKNKKTETEQSILSNLNKTESNPFIEVTKMTINEYVSVEAEKNRLLKNDSNTKKFVREASGEEEKQIIIIEKENLDEPVDESSDEKGE